MKRLLTLTLALVALTVFSGLSKAQQETKQAQEKPGAAQRRPGDTPGALPEITSTRIAAAQIARVQADAAFKTALEVLEEQGEVANLSSGQVLRSPSLPGITEYSFDVTVRGSGEAGEYSKLIYSEQAGQPPFIYFDGNCTIGRKAVAPPQPSETSRFWSCLFTPWEPWNVTSVFCANNNWCIFKRQKATYLTETRRKTCPNGSVQTQTRTVKVHCGC